MESRWRRFLRRVDDYGNDETRDPFTHSSAYHRNFQGYAEWRTPRKSGRGHSIQRLYVADYYKYSESDNIWRLKKFAYTLMFLMMATVSLASDSLPTATNQIPVIDILQMLSLITMIWVLYRLIMQVSSPRRMTIGEHESASEGLKRATFACSWLMLAVAVVTPVGTLIVFRSLEAYDLLATGLKLVGAALSFGLHFAEKARKTDRVPNPVSAPVGANEIW
ncbi:MAG: hypothetical protein LIO72_03735 [Ruminococcus sp.]|nr:hypothetical protein [Ruminococcus sp.]